MTILCTITQIISFDLFTGKKNSPKPEGAGKDKTKAAKPKKSSAKAAKKSESSQAGYLVEYLVSSATATTEELPQVSNITIRQTRM